MMYARLLAAFAAMLLSLLCFDSIGTAANAPEYIIAEAEPASVETEAYLEQIPEETLEAVAEAVGSGVMYTPMAGRCLDDMPLSLAVEETAEPTVIAFKDAENGYDTASVPVYACQIDDMAEDLAALEAELAELERLARQEELAAYRRELEARRRAEEERRRIAREKAERARRIAEAQAAREAALRAACPGYDAAFIATLTAEEQAEAQYFYEQGYVFYRQNWSVLDDLDYGNEGFGLCGCGPTCIAAVISNLAGVPVDPEEMRVYGLSVGSWLPSGGTTYGLLIETAKKYGISATQIYAGDKKALFEALRDENKLVLATMGPGDFTLGAHFMLFRGITDDGKILIADSYSYEHSVKEWDYEELYAQLKSGYWIFEKTE